MAIQLCDFHWQTAMPTPEPTCDVTASTPVCCAPLASSSQPPHGSSRRKFSFPPAGRSPGPSRVGPGTDEAPGVRPASMAILAPRNPRGSGGGGVLGHWVILRLCFFLPCRRVPSRRQAKQAGKDPDRFFSPRLLPAKAHPSRRSSRTGPLAPHPLEGPAVAFFFSLASPR